MVSQVFCRVGERVRATDLDGACDTVGSLKARILGETIRALPEVIEANRVTGSESHVIRARVRSTRHLEELLHHLWEDGDSTTNIVTPLMPYFPLVVAFCQGWVKETGVGTLVSMMLPYSVSLLAAWIVFLLVYWQLGLSLGLEASYTYP